VKYEAMLASGSGDVPVVGGPFDGAMWEFSCHGTARVCTVRPAGVRHEWYELRTWGRLRDGKPAYRDRWVYLGTGTSDGPADRADSSRRLFDSA
jgi:hypothetical protein